ncbi:MAG: gamma-glutamylcyclotransferase [Alphaproteobacteria bacterium]|jgi:glutathione-specific gamma-glutamylcyclotransferase|nr:gamma-glutamylcyclotransferase [Alphaproteobacteria bacterium]MBT4464220.1 gamma-glutamylcyclotransferase [Rhodospirillaceae bacterium]MBT5013632.1 gamma-glutamylcyclotransferase [Rhodospirillaceae bacterium]MBT5308785.1 gamma-glutamylcyclotransferase [Rhodospirillaceae bacterium]MBT7355214.1 gamma-glutamylcyclotransferase [Rhodospirillaceae bacterium]
MVDREQSDETWVFGYGSLMWRPDFPFVEASPALLQGYNRALCIYSTIYRGTEEKPGLVLGLDEGGECHGRAFRLDLNDVDDVMETLHKREMPTNVYTPRFLNVCLEGGRNVQAYTFIVRRDHEQYTGVLSIEEQARLVKQGIGPNGSSLDYLANTLEHLDEMDSSGAISEGDAEQRLHEVLRAVG